ncbi:MAG TPA: TonB-dependent receptor, partial [Kofleriaceae bacterium]
DGPYVHPERFRRGHVLGKWKHDVGGGVASAMVQFYSGRWFDSGYLPKAAIEAGRLSPFSSTDATQGGIERRASASIAYETSHASKKHKNESTWHLGAYIVDSDLRLYTNPTLFRDDTDNGDQIESVDQRVYYGLDGWWRHTYHLGQLTSTLRIGVQARADHVTAETWHDERRLRLEMCGAALNPCTDTTPQQNTIAAYAEKTTDIGRLRVQPGIRIEENVWNVDDKDADTMLGPTTLGGTGARTRITPRLAVQYRLDAVDLFAGANLGALGTDARAAVEHSGYGTYDRTRAAETGARFHPSEQLAAAVSVWWSRVDTHLVWVPSEGEGEIIPREYRRGAEARAVFTPTPWLAFDASLVVARGHTDPDSGPSTPIPLMARTSGNGGVSVTRGPWFGALRMRALGVRDTTDPTRSASGWTLFDIVAGTRWRDFELTLTAQNLFDSRWYEAQYASDVRTSRTVDVTNDLLVSVGQPLTVSLTLGYVPH